MATVKQVLKDAGGSVAEKLLVPPHLIDVVQGYNARVPGPELDAHIEWLAAQIKAKGFDQNQPLELQRNGGRFNLRHGHCRNAAVQLLLSRGEQILVIPSLLEPAGTNDLDRVYRMGTQNEQKSLTDLDYGVLVKRARGYGQTDEQIVEGFGKNKAWLSRILDLASASPDVHEAVLTNRIGATEASKVARRHGEQAGAVVAAAIDHARSEGRQRARPRDVEAVTKPRTEPESVYSLAMAVIRAWRDSEELLDGEDAGDFRAALEALERKIGPLAKAA